MFPTHRESEDVIIRRVTRRLDRVLTQLESQLSLKAKGIQEDKTFDGSEENTGSGTTRSTLLGGTVATPPPPPRIQSTLSPPPIPHPPLPLSQDQAAGGQLGVGGLPPVPKPLTPPPPPLVLKEAEEGKAPPPPPVFTQGSMDNGSSQERAEKASSPQQDLLGGLTPPVLRVRKNSENIEENEVDEGLVADKQPLRPPLPPINDKSLDEFEPPNQDPDPTPQDDSNAPQHPQKDGFDDRMESEYEYLALERDHSLRAKARKGPSFVFILIILIILLGFGAFIAWDKGFLDPYIPPQWKTWLQFWL